MNTHYTLGELQNDINTIISVRELKIIVEPAEPPMIKITKGTKIINQKLGKFLKAHTIWVDEEIKKVVETYKEINSDLSSYKTKLTTDYAKIYETPLYAIDSTHMSCMTGEDCVRVYGYDDNLRLFTIYKNSQLLARTLVRTDRMQYIRLYIDHNKIKSHVAKAIVEKEYQLGTLLGIRLEKIEENYKVVAPYLDGNYQELLDLGEYLEVVHDGEGDYTANQTNGYAEDAHGYTCECCGDRVRDEEVCFVNNGDSALCESCLNENYTWLDEYDDFVHNDYIVRVSVNGNWEYYHKESDSIVYVESEDEYYLWDDVQIVNNVAELAENCVELISTHDGDEYILESDAIEVDNVEEFYSYVVEGFYHRDQLEEMVGEIEEILANVQTDLFTDVEENLKTELDYINSLL